MKNNKKKLHAKCVQWVLVPSNYNLSNTHMPTLNKSEVEKRKEKKKHMGI